MVSSLSIHSGALLVFFFGFLSFFHQQTAVELRIRDWISDLFLFGLGGRPGATGSAAPPPCSPRKSREPYSPAYLEYRLRARLRCAAAAPRRDRPAAARRPRGR